MSADVPVRVWESDFSREGARLTATISRRDVTFRTRVVGSLDVVEITRPGLVIMAESGGIGSDKAIDVCVRAIPDQIKFTIEETPEFVWFAVAATRDAIGFWHIETIPFTEWLRVLMAGGRAK